MWPTERRVCSEFQQGHPVGAISPGIPSFGTRRKGPRSAKLGLAVNRKWKSENGQENEEVSFIDIDAFGKQAELISQYLKKGNPRPGRPAQAGHLGEGREEGVQAQGRPRVVPVRGRRQAGRTGTSARATAGGETSGSFQRGTTCG